MNNTKNKKHRKQKTQQRKTFDKGTQEQSYDFKPKPQKPNLETLKRKEWLKNGLQTKGTSDAGQRCLFVRFGNNVGCTAGVRIFSWQLAVGSFQLAVLRGRC